MQEIYYINKCKEKGLFNEFAEFFIQNNLSFSLSIKNNNDLFTQMTLVKFKDKQKNQILFELWKKSFKELDEQNQALFLNHLSIHINRIIAMTVNNIFKFELERFEKRHQIDCIISEFYCSSCQLFYGYRGIPVSSYMSYVFGFPDIVIEKTLAGLKCAECGDDEFEMVVTA